MTLECLHRPGCDDNNSQTMMANQSSLCSHENYTLGGTRGIKSEKTELASPAGVVFLEVVALNPGLHMAE